MRISSLNNFEKPNRWMSILDTLYLNLKLLKNNSPKSCVTISHNEFNKNQYFNVKKIGRCLA